LGLPMSGWIFSNRFSIVKFLAVANAFFFSNSGLIFHSLNDLMISNSLLYNLSVSVSHLA
jgi:hypothetical protein